MKTLAIGAVVLGALCAGLGAGKHKKLLVFGLVLCGASLVASAVIIGSGH